MIDRISMILIVERDSGKEKKYATVRASSASQERIGQLLRSAGTNFIEGNVTFDVDQGTYDELAKRIVEQFTDAAQSHMHHPKLGQDHFYKTLGITILEEIVKQPEQKE